MKKLYLSILISAVTIISAGAQTTWMKLFSKSSTDAFRSVHEVPAGGYILAGYTSDSSVSDTDAYVVRLNFNGDTIWTSRYDRANSKDLFYKIINTLDGGFLAVGYTSVTGPVSHDFLYVKYDSLGNVSWSKTWGGSGTEHAQDVLQTPDSNYTIVGYTTTPFTYFDAVMVRVNTLGDTIRSRRYATAGGNYDDANAVELLPDGGYIIGGQSNNGATLADMYLVKTDSTGNQIWAKRFGTSGNDNIESIAVVSDGYVLAGNANSGATGDDGYLVKTDTAGTVVWSRTYGGTQPDDFHRIESTTDGGFIISGTTSSSGPLQPNIWLVKTESDGDTTWTRTFGGDNHDHGYSAEQTSDGGYIVAGYSGSFGFNNEEALVIKTDSAGLVNNLLKYVVVSDVIIPNDTMCGGGPVQVKVLIRNFGNAILPNVPVTLVITGDLNQTITATYNGNFYPLDADTVLFTTPIATIGGGTYTFAAYANTSNDVYPDYNPYVETVTMDGNGGPPVAANVPRCGPGTVTLTATGTGMAYWYNNAVGGSLLGSGSTFTTPSINNTTTFYVQLGMNCPSARIAVDAIVNTSVTDPVSNGDVESCGPDSVTLSVTSTDTVYWYDINNNPVDTGLSFTTPVLSVNETFYAVAYNGCTSNQIAVTAVINALPAVDLGPDTNLITGSVYILDAGAGYTSYSWAPNGETTQTISVSSLNNYCVTVTDTNNCTATDCATVDFSIGINDILSSVSGIYPNPASESVNIIFSGSEKSVSISLISSTGQVIRNSQFENIVAGGKAEMKIAEFSPGIYFVKIQSDRGTVIKKLVIE
jgi:hypothetical protein